MKRFPLFPSLAILLAALVLAACGSDSSSSSSSSKSSNTYLGTQAPGDLWTITIGSSSFEANNETTGYSYSGSKATLDNGFLELTVTASTEPGVPTDGSAKAYAFEVPGVVVLVKPAGDDSKIITAVDSGSCPTENTTYNYVNVPSATWDAASSDAYGNASFVVSGSNIEITANNSLLDGSAGNVGTLSGTCSGGQMTFDNDADATAAITPAGVIVVDNGPSDGGAVGVEAPSAYVTKSVITASGREFRGVLFKDNDADEDDTQPVWVRTQTAGSTLEGGTWTDFENNVEDTNNTVTISGFNEQSPGQFAVMLDTVSMTMMVNEIDGKYMIFAIGENDDTVNNPGDAYNVLLMEQ